MVPASRHGERAETLVDRVVLAATGAARVVSRSPVQSLWSGYGVLERLVLEGDPKTVIVKRIAPPASASATVSDARKRRSYAIEALFYERYASRLHAAGAKAARLLAHETHDDVRVLVLSDLAQEGFDRRASRPRGDDLDACLRWLAAFHATFLGLAPEGLWEEGSYWHLATRRDELAAVGDPDFVREAEALDRVLREARHRTWVHGDAKEANFLFSRDRRAAAVDFQYVGGGVGMRDVAYLVEGAGPAEEERALGFYFAALRSHLPVALAADVEREWRDTYDVAVRDFARFLVGWRR